MSEEQLRVSADYYSLQNDFKALCQVFSLPEINYRDISQDEHLASALKRWPLLADFAAPGAASRKDD
ncbi:cellulose biosynthesis protein BcsR [uncultured Pluralibacter sp.]|uniref:cellulose biosynthesis protein BcsR n=1 Tax=uncultured Pluralibacter sp. TaxID=1490864 RepID=UPI002614773E|nr:cellulose biosynthesis protein BcsR [uncultured Pluralibacter sp.]